MEVDALLVILREAAGRVRSALDGLGDWGPAGTRAGQYRSDLAADEAALAVLLPAGLAVLSEESGLTGEGELTAVLDPVDGSTNAARGIPWFATSICVVDGEGPLAAVVVNQATGARYEAARGLGATLDGERIEPSGVARLGSAVLGIAGYPPAYFGWRQFRALGAAALDLCCVAAGSLDGYADCSMAGHGVWDYLGGLLVCREAGAFVADADGGALVVLDPGARRAPIAAATEELLFELSEKRAGALSGASGRGRASREGAEDG